MTLEDTKNVQLQLIRFPLEFEPLKPLEGELNHILVGINDPSVQRTSTPMTAIHLVDKKKAYNDIIEEVKRLNNLYYNTDGHINNPQQFTQDKKSELLKAITDLGRDIKDLFAGQDINFDKWLERILIPQKNRRSSNQHLTIITNDITIPWYWMKCSKDSLFLCEACSVGMQQLEVDLSKKYDNMIDSFNVIISDAKNDALLDFLKNEFKHIKDPEIVVEEKGKTKYRIEFKDIPENGRKYDELSNEASKENIREIFEKFSEDGYQLLFEDYPYRILLINASSTLPLSGLEMQNLECQLAGKDEKDRGYKFIVDLVSSRQDLRDVIDRYKSDKQIVEHYKILHFSGHWHYSSEHLVINNDKISIKQLLDPIIKKALLVLDGCSSAKDLSGWTDIGGITTRLINLGALGCITTVLPIKHDPIKGKIFWDEFYKTLRRPAGSIGQSLVTARNKLRDYYDKFDPQNPDWLYYQLIGNPTVEFFETENF